MKYILLNLLLILAVIGGAGAMVSVLVSAPPLGLLFAFFGGAALIGAHALYKAII